MGGLAASLSRPAGAGEARATRASASTSAAMANPTACHSRHSPPRRSSTATMPSSGSRPSRGAPARPASGASRMAATRALSIAATSRRPWRDRDDPRHRQRVHGAAWPHGCRGALVGEVDWGFRVSGIQLLPPLRFGDGWGPLADAPRPVEEPFSFGGTRSRPRPGRAGRRTSPRSTCPRSPSRPGTTPTRARRWRTPRAGRPKRLLLGPWKHDRRTRGPRPDRVLEVMAAWFGRLAWRWVPLLCRTSRRSRSSRALAGAGGRRSWPPADAECGRSTPTPTAGWRNEAPDGPTETRSDVDPTVGLAALPWDWTTPTPTARPTSRPTIIARPRGRPRRSTAPLLITGAPGGGGPAFEPAGSDGSGVAE